MLGLGLDAGGWGQKGGSCTKEKTLKSILCAKEVAETLSPHPVILSPPMAGPSVSFSCASFIQAWVGTLRPHPTCSHFLPFCHLLPLILLSGDSWKPLNRWQPWQPSPRGWAWPADLEGAGANVGFSCDADLGGGKREVQGRGQSGDAGQERESRVQCPAAVRRDPGGVQQRCRALHPSL